ncbi:DUF1007 family protein [Litchfieldella xinjiangensis]|uniref:DUF1007 family protein n=1 Tax=Litchfieldella xinjiangensis TaxID=1166948 RepID=UPI0006948FE6|nr:DUF1007 family protein [Halomonas xinjiangensis]
MGVALFSRRDASRLAIAALVWMGSAGWSTLATAHPHGWFDLSMGVVVSETGEAEALHQRWRLDPFYSLVLVEELQAAGGDASMASRLDQLGSEIVANLAPHHYYTELTLGGRQVAMGAVESYSVDYREGRIEFSFHLPLETPQSLAGKTLRYQVFDPTYYIEVVHEADDDNTPREDALQLSQAMPACQSTIEPANPDPALVARAAMLDVDEQAEPGLGRHFAETGVVTCD